MHCNGPTCICGPKIEFFVVEMKSRDKMSQNGGTSIIDRDIGPEQERVPMMHFGPETGIIDVGSLSNL